MPRWRPIGRSSESIKIEDGADCLFKVAGCCAIPSLPGVMGSDVSNAPNALSLDHIYEQANFGSDHRPENLLTVHRVCNSVRGKRAFLAYVGREGALKIARTVPRVAPTIYNLLRT